ncbi:MAG: histidine phosphotransferase family protein [Pseudomonadota bacterium]
MTDAIATLLDRPTDAPAPDAAAPPLDFAGLLGSRICHDLISPVGAIGNGLELLSELGRGAGTPGAELQLIADSARAASDTLQFYRLAFGAASATEETGAASARRVILGWAAHQKPQAVWTPTVEAMPRAAARLLCNLVQCAVSALPRGGAATVVSDIAGDALAVEARGPTVTLPEAAAAWLSAAPAAPTPSPRDAHFIAAARHAAAIDARIKVSFSDDLLRLETGPA